MSAALRVRLPLLVVAAVLAFALVRGTGAADGCPGPGACDVAGAPAVQRREVLLGATLAALLGAGMAVWLRARAIQRRA